MKTIPISFLVALFYFSSCSKDPISDFTDDNDYSNIIDANDEIGFCTELYADDHSRAFGPKNLFWNKNILKVRFMGGTGYVQNKIKQYAAYWSKHANITFQFVENEPSDIRISFDQDDGSWSYIGRSNAYINSNKATMNFGWFSDRTSDTEFRRTTLHEFGHAIGLAHEHQHPLTTINWNRTAVYNYYEKTQGWTRSEVDNNIFDKYSAATSNYTEYDPRSIMHYYIPRSLVNGNWNPTSNTNLSNLDIQFIGKMYPKDQTDDGTSFDCTCPDNLSIITCDNFENYDQQSYQSSGLWSRWSNTAGYAELQTYTWGRVLKIAYDASQNPDILFKPGDLGTQSFSISWDMYVGSGSSAYFNIQKFPLPGQEFGAQVYFDKNQSGRVEINNQQVGFEYQQNSWNRISLEFNLDQNFTQLIIDNQKIANWPSTWTARSTNGVSEFSAINFYAIDQDTRFWLDDFCVSDIVEPTSLAYSLNFSGNSANTELKN